MRAEPLQQMSKLVAMQIEEDEYSGTEGQMGGAAEPASEAAALISRNRAYSDRSLSRTMPPKHRIGRIII